MYENDIYSNAGNDSYKEVNEEPQAEKEKHKGGVFRKMLLSISLGLLFGLFAGIGFYAVQQGTGMLQSDTQLPGDESFDIKQTLDAENVDDIVENRVINTGNLTVVSADISDVVEEVMPAMVSITNNYTAEISSFWGPSYYEQYEGSGSGIIVSENETELLVVTNNHVVEDADKLSVTFINGSTVEAVPKGTDPEMDLAVVAIALDSLDDDTREAIAIATLGDSDELRLGEPVIAIGNALGYGQSVTNGIVSALDRKIELEDGSAGTYIQTNAAINQGNSGGALLNIKGEVIGINSVKIGGEAVEGMGYAIPITSASPIIADMLERQTRNKVAEEDMGYIGIELQEVTTQISQMFNMPGGIYITNLVNGGAAEEAGLMIGDIITHFDGERITSYNDLQSLLQYFAAGDSVSVKVMRPENGEYVQYDFELTLGQRPE
ncbi:MAG: trypsin-like peptidase domain-containing protein [Candidatus Gastranaerophilales bacterium]|nr:trypsin-like peptidase domain-containing protein [Candidatus Gastranaerophilales bacterium]